MTSAGWVGVAATLAAVFGPGVVYLIASAWPRRLAPPPAAGPDETTPGSDGG